MALILITVIRRFEQSQGGGGTSGTPGRTRPTARRTRVAAAGRCRPRRHLATVATVAGQPPARRHASSGPSVSDRQAPAGVAGEISARRHWSPWRAPSRRPRPPRRYGPGAGADLLAWHGTDGSCRARGPRPRPGRPRHLRPRPRPPLG